MTRILLLRHGHVAGIVPKRFRGQLDIPLSEEGRAQARAAADYVALHYRPEAVYSSPLERCRDSAAPLATRLGLPAPSVARGFTDIHYGLWQGQLATEVAASEPERYALWLRSPQELTFPQGESLTIVASRAQAELAALAHRHHGGCVAVYSHDSVIRTTLLGVLGAPFTAYHRMEVDPCSLSEIRFGEHVELVRINERTGPVAG